MRQTKKSHQVVCHLSDVRLDLLTLVWYWRTNGRLGRFNLYLFSQHNSANSKQISQRSLSLKEAQSILDKSPNSNDKTNELSSATDQHPKIGQHHL